MIVRPYKGARPVLGERVYLAETAAFIGDVVRGDDVSIWYGSVVRGDCCSIRIGARTNVQDNSTLHVTRDVGPLLLEEEVTLGHNCVVHACTIRRGALVGMNATVLDGAVIGEKSLIAAGSLVAGGTVVPPGTLWAGSPARFRRDLTAIEISGLDTYWKNYLDYKEEYLREDARLGRIPPAAVPLL